MSDHKRGRDRWPTLFEQHRSIAGSINISSGNLNIGRDPSSLHLLEKRLALRLVRTGRIQSRCICHSDYLFRVKMVLFCIFLHRSRINSGLLE